MERAVYRSQRQAVAVVGIACVYAWLILSAAWGDGGTSSRVVGTVLVVAGVGGALLVARSRVETSDQGVTIVNPLRKRRLSWDEVENFHEGSARFVSRLGVARTRDGSTIPMFGTAGPNRRLYPDHRLTANIVEQLNADLSKRR